MMLLPTIPISNLPVGPMPVDWQDLPPTYLNFGELEIIVALLRAAARQDIIVEIGLAEGRTAKAILRELPHVQKYIGIDTSDAGYQPKLRSQWTERSPSPGYLALNEPRFDRWLLPRGSLDLTADDFPPVDAVFIDGDHSSEVVRHDSDLARAIVREGGIVIWHDASNVSVEVHSVLTRLVNEGWPINQIEGTWLAFMKV
jgi:hypothetical protein